MKKKTFCLIILVLVSLSFVFAKRRPPPEVPPIVYNGYEYNAGYTSGLFSGEGLVSVKSIENFKVEKYISVYRIWYNPFMELDVQQVFISKMELMNDNIIRIINEHGNEFYLNLKSYKVQSVPCAATGY